MLRFSVARWFAVYGFNGLPYATFTVNVLGSFLIGFLFVAMEQKWLVSDSVRTALITGGLGGFTTYSAFSLEVVLLLQQGELVKSFFYVLATLLLCFLACFIGVFLAKHMI